MMARTSRAALLAAALLACCIGQGAAVLNATAAAVVTQLSAANPTVLATADGIVKAVQQRLLVSTLTGNLNVKALAADPTVQASFVPLVESAELASGPAWLAVNPPLVPVTKNVTAATKVVAAAAADDATVAWVGKLIAAVQSSAGLTGWNIQTLAADPNVQAAVVPVLLSTANVSGLEWAKVDGSALVAAQNTATLQATDPASAAAGTTDLQAQPAAAAQQPSLLPALPNIFGRKLQQVILNPGDLVGLRTDNTKATPSAADAARLGAALGLQSAPPPEAQQWAQEQQAYKDSVRTSTPATIQNALQNFNGVQINPSKLYAPGAPKSNNAPLTPEQKPQAQPAATPQATPQALGPATVVYGKGPKGYVSGSAPVGSQVYLPAQSSAQGTGPTTGLSQASYQQASDSSAGSTSASQYASSQAATPGTSSDASQAASSQAAAPVAFFGNARAVSSQAAAPVAYSGSFNVATTGTDAAAASPATSVPSSRLNPGVLQRPSSAYDASAAAPVASGSSYSAAASTPATPDTSAAAPVASGSSYSAAASTPATPDTSAAAPVVSSSSYSTDASTPTTPDTSASAGATPVAPAAPDSSATGAQSLLSSLGGSLADSPGVAPAPPGANFNWLQPSTRVTQVPTSVVQAMAAKAPSSSPTSQGVRDFVNQAGFQDSSGSAQISQQAGSAANSGGQQQQQGRRLAEGPAVSGPPATAQRPGPGQDPSITARLMNTFGPSATALLNASGKNFLQAVPSSVPGATPPASDLIQLLGPAVSDVADTAAALVPAPASAAHGQATSIGGEVAAGSAHAPATSMESEVTTHAKAPAPAPGAAAAALAARGAQLQGPRPPFQDAIDAVAGLPGALGLLPRLPGMPGSSASLQAQDGAQGISEAGQSAGAGAMLLPPGMGRRR